MLLARWGEFCSVPHCRERCQRLMDSCPFRVLVCVLKRDCEYAWIGLLEH